MSNPIKQISNSDLQSGYYVVYCKKYKSIYLIDTCKERAINFVKNFNPRIYADNTLTASDFEIRWESNLNE